MNNLQGKIEVIYTCQRTIKFSHRIDEEDIACNATGVITVPLLDYLESNVTLICPKCKAIITQEDVKPLPNYASMIRTAARQYAMLVEEALEDYE